jgi:uncharacterized protein
MPPASAEGRGSSRHTRLPTRECRVTVRDGTEIACALYLPEGTGPWPALFAASPYRFDNNVVPEMPLFLWRETGPIEWYNEQGYAFVHMDVRGSGASGGEYCFLGQAEQDDLCEVIQWIAGQSWSTGKIGGIGQSYYAMTQWLAACANPTNLSCIAAFDGFTDPYRASIYTGGIPGDFFHLWYNQVCRVVNHSPARGASREMAYDLSRAIREHPLYDDFWKERAAAERLSRSRVPLLSVGVLGKMDLHLNGNIVGYQLHGGEKKLVLTGAANVHAAVTDYADPGFHQRWLLPFYDHYLKGAHTVYSSWPRVQYYIQNQDRFAQSDVWPPPPAQVRTLYLSAAPSHSVTSLNDGSLLQAPPPARETVAFSYPNPGWRFGVVGLDEHLAPDPVRRVLTFTGAPLEQDWLIAGPIKLLLYASSTNTDTDFIVKLSDQFPQDAAQASQGRQPRAKIISKGWLRASHRALDPARSTDLAPVHAHTRREPLEPGTVYAFEIAIMPTSYCVAKGHRLRLEIANADSPVTDMIFTHEYQLFKVGTDTHYFGTDTPAQLRIPVMAAESVAAGGPTGAAQSGPSGTAAK